jgi:hypothetical protein
MRKDDPQQEGALTYGPYETLAPGRYAFELDYSSSRPKQESAGGWEVAVTLPRGSRALVRGDLPGTANVNSTLRGEFAIATGQTEKVELTTFSSKGGTMGVSALRIRRIE